MTDGSKVRVLEQREMIGIRRRRYRREIQFSKGTKSKKKETLIARRSIKKTLTFSL